MIIVMSWLSKRYLFQCFPPTLKHQASSFKSVFEIVFVMDNYGRYGLALKLKLRFQTPPAKCRLGLSSKLWLSSKTALDKRLYVGRALQGDKNLEWLFNEIKIVNETFCQTLIFCQVTPLCDWITFKNCFYSNKFAKNWKCAQSAVFCPIKCPIKVTVYLQIGDFRQISIFRLK